MTFRHWKFIVVLVCAVIAGIIGLDAYTLRVLCTPEPDLVHLQHARQYASSVACFFVLPLAGLEVQNYLDQGNSEDMVCIFALAVDVGFRLNTLVHMLKKSCAATPPMPDTHGHESQLGTKHTDTTQVVQNNCGTTRDNGIEVKVDLEPSGTDGSRACC